MSLVRRTSWSFEDERTFIRGLGKGTHTTNEDGGQRITTGRFELLQRYRDALLKRTNWDDLRAPAVFAFLDMQIEKASVAPA